MRQLMENRLPIFERLSIGWEHIFDTFCNWCDHLTVTPEEYYFEFWDHMNFDKVSYEEESEL